MRPRWPTAASRTAATKHPAAIEAHYLFNVSSRMRIMQKICRFSVRYDMIHRVLMLHVISAHLPPNVCLLYGARAKLALATAFSRAGRCFHT